jgi:co-chaperonin GroES (HSP10)
MLRAALVLVALCAVSVNGLGFLNSALLPLDFETGVEPEVAAARLRLFRDLIYTPTNVATAFPLRDYVLLEVYQANNVDPFNAASPFRTSLFFNPVAFNTESNVGVVVALGPNTQQRNLFGEGQRVIFTKAGGERVSLNGIVYYLVPEANLLGALDIGSSTAAAQRFSAYVNQGNTLNVPTLRANAFVRSDFTYF